LVPGPKTLKKDENESSPHLVVSTSRLLETTCSESDEDLTSKVASIEKMQTTHVLVFILNHYVKVATFWLACVMKKMLPKH
jgi:hypothetical protein